MWMPPQTTRPPLRTWRSASGTRAPTGAKMIAASSGSGGAVAGILRRGAAERQGEGLRFGVAGAGEGVDAAALPDRDLGEDVGGGAEAVEAEHRRLAGQLERAVADQAGAEQRRRLDVAERVGKGEGVAGVGDAVGGEAAVAGEAGEQGIVAEILAALAAIGAMAAGPAEPGNADPVADAEALRALAQRRDPADDLVAGHDRQRALKVAVDDMEIGPADAAGGDLDQQLARAGRRHRPLDRRAAARPAGPAASRASWPRLTASPRPSHSGRRGAFAFRNRSITQAA